MTPDTTVSFNFEFGMARLLLFCLFLCANYSLGSDDIPLPFEGLYESRGSFAKEKVAADQWRNIPQDVQLLVVKDEDIIELQLLIDVHSSDSSGGLQTYTIANQMWLVKKPEQPGNAEPGRVDFDVYKSDRSSTHFEDLGDGYCVTSECRYSYITTKPGREQRYHSSIVWQPGRIRSEFKQTGSLSVRKDGEFEWMTYKTWENIFKPKRQDR